MNPQTGSRSHFEARLRRQRKTWADVAGCVIGQDCESVTVDLDHPDYPTRVTTCGNCGGRHTTDACPIPAGFDGDYRKDSGGTDGCNCA